MDLDTPTKDPLSLLKERCESLEYASTMIMGVHNKCTFQVTLKVNKEKTYITSAPTTPIAIRKAALAALKDVRGPNNIATAEEIPLQSKNKESLNLSKVPANATECDKDLSNMPPPLFVKNPLQTLKKRGSKCNVMSPIKIPKLETAVTAISPENKNNKENEIANCNEAPNQIKEVSDTLLKHNPSLDDKLQQEEGEINVAPIAFPANAASPTNIDAAENSDENDILVINAPNPPPINLISSGNDNNTPLNDTNNESSSVAYSNIDNDDAVIAIIEVPPTIDLASDENQDVVPNENYSSEVASSNYVSPIPMAEETATIDLDCDDNQEKEEIINECVSQLLANDDEISSEVMERNEEDKGKF